MTYALNTLISEREILNAQLRSTQENIKRRRENLKRAQGQLADALEDEAAIWKNIASIELAISITEQLEDDG